MAEWRTVIGYDRYTVSDEGQIRGPRGHLTFGATGSRGYLQAYLRHKGDRRGTTRNVHVLVAEAFIGPRPPGLHVCHADGDKTNNKLSNLRYDTPKANWEDFRQNPQGNNTAILREKCPIGHPLEAPNLVPSQLKRGWRTCLACNRAHAYTSIHKDQAHRVDELAEEYYQYLMETQ